METPIVTPPAVVSSASLYGLPNELLLNITGYLEPEELLELRLVCRRFGQHFYPTMPTEWIIVADSPRQLRKLIKMTEPGQPGCLLDKLILVETLPVYLPKEQCVEGGNLNWSSWKPKAVSELAEESSSEYEPSECSSEEYDENEDMIEDWEGEYIGSEEENDNDLSLEELTTKYAAVVKTSDDPAVDWDTLWPPYYLPPYYDKRKKGNDNHVLPDDIEPTDWRWPLGSWDSKEKTLTTLLAHAFRNLRRNTEEKRLTELDLKVASLKEGVAERDINRKAPATMFGELFHRVAVALHMSKLKIIKLTLGNGQDVLHCGRLENILHDNWGRYTTKLDLRPSLCHLKKLSIKFAYFSDDTGVGCGHRSCPDKHEVYGEVAIVELLKHTPYLRTLRLHGYQSWKSHWPMLDQIINACGLSRGGGITSITLDGFGLEDGELRYFLGKFTRLQSLTLKALYLTPDDYKRVFEIIEKEMPELSYLHLNNLYEVDGRDDVDYVEGSEPRLVYFEGPGKSHFPPDDGPNSITRFGVEARTAIQKKTKFPGQGQSSDSPTYLEWERRWKNNYGGLPESS